MNMKDTEKRGATWIWFPGDFECMLFNKCMAKRYERGKIITPFWRLDGYYRNVKFYRRFALKKKTEISLLAEGNYNVYLDGKGYIDVKGGVFSLPAGEYGISVLVNNNEGLPCIFVESDSLISDAGWTVTCQDGEFLAVGCWDFKKDELPNKYRLAVKECGFMKKERKNGGFLYDSGRETMAYLRIKDAPKNEKIEVFYGESLAEALDEKNCEQTDVFYPQTDDFAAPLTKAFRYVHIKGKNNFKVSLYEELAPCENRSEFTADDKLLSDIWDIAVRTQELTTREFFIDGIKRDRWSWSGDAILSELFNFYTCFDKETVKRTIRALGGKLPIKTHINHIMDYTNYWLISIEEYYRFTGDREFVKEMLPLAREYVNFCVSRLDKDGFLDNKPEDWIFIDWADMNNEGETSFEQILFCAALKKTARLLEALGEDAGEYVRLADGLFERTKKVFCKDGRFRHSRKNGVMGEKITLYSNIFAVLYDFADDKMREATKDMFFDDKIQKITTPYMRFYELVAMSKLGLWDEMRAALENYWGGMVKDGVTSFWEQYDPEVKDDSRFGMYGRPYGKSLCHAWGAAPVYLIGGCIFGIGPESDGYKSFVCRPNPDLLCDCRLKIPTNGGFVIAEKRGDEFILSNIGCPGTLIIPPGWTADKNREKICGGEIGVEKDGAVSIYKLKEKRDVVQS